jgi:hypothetical protein
LVLEIRKEKLEKLEIINLKPILKILSFHLIDIWDLMPIIPWT